ncbi:MAG TPA: acetyl-CoA C-acetyltransferase [Chloroflexota bacterium]|jgi:acetyl-CoA C-acetyltransferase|nr:acetyl-CoA C-acetyltransferase [Chloroflexota bacterium]
MSDEGVFILSGARLPIGRFLGRLSGLTAPELGARAAKAAVERAGVDPGEIDEVILGNVVQAGVGQAPARQAALTAGVPDAVPATTINKVCGSGLKAVMLAAQAIRAGDGDLYLAGGMESMSNAPHLLTGARRGYRLGNAELVDAVIHDGLWCAHGDEHMGVCAERIAQCFGVGREEQDRFALESHRKAVAAAESGAFRDELVPVEVPGPTRGSSAVVDRDEGPRADTSLEALAALKPVFRPDGCVTAGNAPGLSDGAAALVVASGRARGRLGKKPLARIVGQAQAAREPGMLFAAPPLAIRRLLERVGWELGGVDLIELNEAFSAQVLANHRELGWDWAKFNVHGGAVALGHPIGASGARVLVGLIYALRARGGGRGIASLCLGGGGAVALAVEVE